MPSFLLQGRDCLWWRVRAGVAFGSGGRIGAGAAGDERARADGAADHTVLRPEPGSAAHQPAGRAPPPRAATDHSGSRSAAAAASGCQWCRSSRRSERNFRYVHKRSIITNRLLQITKSHTSRSAFLFVFLCRSEKRENNGRQRITM